MNINVHMDSNMFKYKQRRRKRGPNTYISETHLIHFFPSIIIRKKKCY